jgi:tripartite-type tricarboxylate transporter receptor subunit TctC
VSTQANELQAYELQVNDVFVKVATSVERRSVLKIAVALAAGLNSMPARAQSYPVRPVRVMLPYPPGGPTDVLVRIVAAKLSEAMGQSFTVDNKAGASGMIGSAEVAKAAPDGYTLLGNASIHVINPSLYPKAAFDAIADFTPITQLANVPLILVVNNDLPVKNVRELIAYGKANPARLNFASSGNAAAQHLAGESFKIATGVQMQHVPYKGSTPALTDVIGGQVQLMFDSMPSATPFVKSGKLRALAVSTSKRSPAFPDLPTIAEAGVPGFDISTWYGLWAPKSTPKDIVERIAVEVAKILKSPEVRDRYAALGAEPIGSSPEEFAAYCKSELLKWGRIVKESGAKAD